MILPLATLCLSFGVMVVPSVRPPAPKIKGPQNVQTVTNATELDPNDSRGKRASGLVAALLNPDAATAEKYLKAHAAAGSPAAASVPQQVKDLRLALAAGFAIDRIVAGQGDDVIVMVKPTAADRGGRLAMRVEVERTSPHHIKDVQVVPSRRQSGGI